VSTAAIPDRFTTLPDEAALNATVVALEEHGFWAPGTRITCPAHAEGGLSWLPLDDAISSDPPSFSACTLPTAKASPRLTSPASSAGGCLSMAHYRD
jgi:hypothetical protein